MDANDIAFGMRACTDIRRIIDKLPNVFACAAVAPDEAGLIQQRNDFEVFRTQLWPEDAGQNACRRARSKERWLAPSQIGRCRAGQFSDWIAISIDYRPPKLAFLSVLSANGVASRMWIGCMDGLSQSPRSMRLSAAMGSRRWLSGLNRSERASVTSREPLAVQSQYQPAGHGIPDPDIRAHRLR
jgi:hypothetical protein